MRAVRETTVVDGDPYETMSYFYDTFAALNGATQTAPSRSAFVSLASDGQHVVDVGSGTGTIAGRIAEKGCTVHAAEPSRAMRAVHLSKLSSSPDVAARVTVVPLEVPFPSLDYAVFAGVLQCFAPPERRRLLERVAAAARPGALIALDMVADGPANATAPVRAAQAQVGRSRYEMWVETVPLGADAARQLVEYRHFLDDRPLATETLERHVHVHGREAVRADLGAVGFETVSGADGGDGGDRGSGHRDGPFPDDFVVARKRS